MEDLPPGSLVHTELTSEDVDATKEFFARIFGWEYDSQPMPDGEGAYHMWRAGGRTFGGITPPWPDAEPGVLNYLAVQDVDATAEAIEEAGGKILNGPMDVGDSGRMAVFEEPGGCRMAIWQAKR